MQLLFASSNKNKIREVTQLLPEGFSLYGLQDIGIEEEIPEPGSTIKENSFLKANYVVEKLKKDGKKMVVFADDSGLEAEALDNAPGVYSARYAGVPKSDTANNEKLIKELSSQLNRKARFVTVITLISNGAICYFEGEVKGTISNTPRGNNGFGYDPLFVPEGYSKTFAEFTSEEKNAISHRGRAVQKLIEFLKSK